MSERKTAAGLTIAEVAKATGTTAHTLRYYERIGLIRGVLRAKSGHRRYTDEDIRWVEFLRKLQATGMPIRHMLRYATLRRRGESTVTERRKILEEHRIEVLAKIAEQTAHLAVLDRKVRMYKEMEEEERRLKRGA